MIKSIVHLLTLPQVDGRILAGAWRLPIPCSYFARSQYKMSRPQQARHFRQRLHYNSYQSHPSPVLAFIHKPTDKSSTVKSQFQCHPVSCQNKDKQRPVLSCGHKVSSSKAAQSKSQLQTSAIFSCEPKEHHTICPGVPAS